MPDVPEINDVHDWLALGIEKGFCTQALCVTHDGIPDTVEEEAEWDDGGDPCQPVVRLLFGDEEFSAGR